MREVELLRKLSAASATLAMLGTEIENCSDAAAKELLARAFDEQSAIVRALLAKCCGMIEGITAGIPAQAARRERLR